MAISFGPDWQDALWASPYRLRFELAVGETRLGRFTAAYDRARTLARAAIPSQRPMAVIAGCPEPEREFLFRAHYTGAGAFEVLEDLGVPTHASRDRWRGRLHSDHDEEFPPWLYRALRVSWEEADILLWINVAIELAVQPIAPVKSKLVDVGRAISVYAYDDRGMDIIALSREPLLPLYKQFDGWLLDYDRPRMAQAFE